MNDLLRAKLICKILLKQMSYILNENVEKIIILVNIVYLLFVKRYL